MKNIRIIPRLDIKGPKHGQARTNRGATGPPATPRRVICM